MPERPYMLGDTVNVRRPPTRGKPSGMERITGKIVFTNERFFVVESDGQGYKESFLWQDIETKTITVSLRSLRLVKPCG